MAPARRRREGARRVSRGGSVLDVGVGFRSRAVFAPLVILAAVACAGADGAGAEKGAQTMRVVTSERSIEVAVGEGIDLVVSRPVGIPEQLQQEWPAAPSVEGEAVRFLKRRVEAPPPDADGGVTRLHFELEAISAGAAKVVLVPRPASPEAPRTPVVLEVTVRASAAAPETLAGVVVRLVGTVASPSPAPLEVARAFGEVESDSEGAVYVKPGDPRLKRVVVVKRHATGDLNDVQLQLASPDSLRVAELERLWGAPARPPLLAIGETKLVFRPPVSDGARFRATVALTLDGDETGPVTWVDVIRDAL